MALFSESGPFANCQNVRLYQQVLLNCVHFWYYGHKSFKVYLRVIAEILCQWFVNKCDRHSVPKLNMHFYFFSTNVVMNYTEIEAKVREATNDEAWGPTGIQTGFCLLLFFLSYIFSVTSKGTNCLLLYPTSGALMQEIAQATFTYEHFPEVMQMLWKRMLQDNKKNWRRTYKVSSLNPFKYRNCCITTSTGKYVKHTCSVIFLLCIIYFLVFSPVTFTFELPG